MRTSLNRRNFLRAGGVAIALPMMESLSPVARAAEGKKTVKRKSKVTVDLDVFGDRKKEPAKPKPKPKPAAAPAKKVSTARVCAIELTRVLPERPELNWPKILSRRTDAHRLGGLGRTGSANHGGAAVSRTDDTGSNGGLNHRGRTAAQAKEFS